jgi:hypothetical protein
MKSVRNEKRHNSLSQMPFLLLDQEINMNGLYSKLCTGAMFRPCAVLSTLSHELLCTFTVDEVKKKLIAQLVCCRLSCSPHIKVFRGKTHNGYFPIAQTRYTLNEFIFW